jgi:hypothetical protein
MRNISAPQRSHNIFDGSQAARRAGPSGAWAALWENAGRGEEGLTGSGMARLYGHAGLAPVDETR